MLETTIQYTCDGCGVTEIHCEMSVTKGAVRAVLKSCGWRSYGVLDYCEKCVENGKAKRRDQSFGEVQEIK